MKKSLLVVFALLVACGESEKDRHKRVGDARRAKMIAESMERTREISRGSEEAAKYPSPPSYHRTDELSEWSDRQDAIQAARETTAAIEDARDEAAHQAAESRRLHEEQISEIRATRAQINRDREESEETRLRLRRH